MRGTGARSEHLVHEVARECARAGDPLDLLERVAARVRPVIGYAAAGWILVDPDTLLMNGVHTEGVDRQTHLALIEQEMSGSADVTRFADLVGAPLPAAALSAATGGDLAASTRWRTVYQPAGYGDELRAVFGSCSVTWGLVCLSRLVDDSWFTPAEVQLLARLCPYVADGIRTGLALCRPGRADRAESPALVVLRDDGSVESMTDTVPEWFGDPEDESLRTTIVLHQVARRARALAADTPTGEPSPTTRPGDAATSAPAAVPPARAWARTSTGESVIVRGARLSGDGPGRTVLVLDPATQADLAPLLMELRGLTPREREVTRLLLTGKPTRQIAAELWITPETLRGHVKNVLAKLDVSSRAELSALLSRQPRSQRQPAEPASRRSR